VSGTIAVLIVDDHAMFADALVALLETEEGIGVVGAVATGEEAVALCGPSAPDVVLMDIDLPGMDGIASTREVLRVCPEAKVIGISALRDPDLLARAVAAGAAGLVPKTRAADELVRAVRAAAAGEIVLPEGDVGPALDRLRTAAHRTPLVNVGVNLLTDREVEILQTFADGMSTEDVATALRISPRTVRAHVESILAKLGVHSKLQAVLLGLRSGVIALKASEHVSPPLSS
jgi:two-component system, NarL family, response regulator LiaR